MQRTPHGCPHCSQPLWISNDMWGPYYVCEECGWTAEDDDQLKAQPVRDISPALMANTPEVYGVWQATQGR